MDRYKIIEQIGRGGMSRVFLVVDGSGERKALKETRRTAGEAGTGYLKNSATQASQESMNYPRGTER